VFDHQECFDLLYPLSDPAQALEVVQQRFTYKMGLVQTFRDTFEAKLQQALLSNEVGGNNSPVKPKQKM